MNDIKFVAFDIDGTLVDDNKQFPADFPQTVDYLLNKNIKIMVGSGRSLKALLRDFKDYKDKFYFAAENGAIVYYQGNKQLNNYLPRETALKIMQHLDKLMIQDLQLNYVVSCVDHAYILDNCSKSFKDFLYPYYQIDTIDSFANINEEVIKIAGFAPNDSKNRLERKSLSLNQYCDVVYSGDQWCDFNPKGVSKGKAISEVLSLLNLSKDNAAAFGDADNDISMLEAVSYSVAMINGNDNIKSKAKYITKLDNNCNGAIKFLLELLQQ